MSGERDKALGEFRQQIGGIDPVLDQAADYGRAIKATQDLARRQGQVMSEALSNNHLLYHTNKALKEQLTAATREASAARHRVAQLEQQLAAAQEYAAKLEAAGGDRFQALYEQCRTVLLQSLHDTLQPDELKDKLDDMKKQAEELRADPTMLTLEQIEKIRET